MSWATTLRNTGVRGAGALGSRPYWAGLPRRWNSAAWVAALVCLGLVARAPAERPLTPLPLPDFTFDLESPTVMQGLVKAGDILTFDGRQPVTLVRAEQLGLLSPQDALDGLSGPNPTGPPSTFVLLFSVDRQTVGTTPPDPELVRLNVPYNAYDQARRGQAAGDEYMSLLLYTPPALAGAEGAAAALLPSANNVLVRNNYDEGGTEFGAQPPGSASTNFSGMRVPQDNVDGFALLPRGPAGVPQQIYFSLTAQSPSLPRLSGTAPPSGANIFFKADPNGPLPTELYATASQLHLQINDDIDALIVFDLNQNGQYDGPDFVLFSLAPGSPSLHTIPGASPVGAAADVFLIRPGLQTPLVFAHAAEFGLGAQQDNIDALDYTFCANPIGCAVQHGIRIIRGDLNCDGVVNFDDINPFVLALNGQAGYLAHYPNCDWRQADCNCDGAVDFGDINPFVSCLSSGHCGCP